MKKKTIIYRHDDSILVEMDDMLYEVCGDSITVEVEETYKINYQFDTLQKDGSLVRRIKLHRPT